MLEMIQRFIEYENQNTFNVGDLVKFDLTRIMSTSKSKPVMIPKVVMYTDEIYSPSLVERDIQSYDIDSLVGSIGIISECLEDCVSRNIYYTRHLATSVVMFGSVKMIVPNILLNKLNQ